MNGRTAWRDLYECPKCPKQCFLDFVDSGPNVKGVHTPYGGGTLDTGFASLINEPHPTIIPFKAATEIASLHKIIEQGACSVIAFVFLGMAEGRDDM